MMRAMTADEMARAIERSEMLTTYIQSIDWSTVHQIMVEWGDDSEEIPPSTIGDSEVMVTQPTKEYISIVIICNPGSLPIPRNKDGSPSGDGVFL